MDSQDMWTACLVVPSIVLGLVAWQARRVDRTTLGLGLRDGAVSEFVRGCLFSVPCFVALVAVYDLTGLTGAVSWRGGWGSAAGIAVYFLVLFSIEEVVFRSLFMTGLGVLAGRLTALAGTAVLVAGAYAFAPDTGILPVAGAVITNLLTGLARWRTGRIWWGLGQRWLWNSCIVGFGFSDSAYHLDKGLMHQPLAAADWLTGGGFGVEGGLVGIGFQVVMLAAVAMVAHGRHGPWTIRPKKPQPLPIRQDPSRLV
jgi:uncharacterized protein